MEPVLMSDGGLTVFECYNGYYCEDKHFLTFDEAHDYFYDMLMPDEVVLVDASR